MSSHVLISAKETKKTKELGEIKERLDELTKENKQLRNELAATAEIKKRLEEPAKENEQQRKEFTGAAVTEKLDRIADTSKTIIPGMHQTGIGAYDKAVEWKLDFTAADIARVLGLVLVGVILWVILSLINRYIPMQATIKQIVNIVFIIVVIVWLLGAFGIIDSFHGIGIGIRIVIDLVLVGVILWLINRYIPMQATIKQVVNIVVIIVVIIWLLSAFGIMDILQGIFLGKGKP